MTKDNEVRLISITAKALHTIRTESLRSSNGLETGGILLGTDSPECAPMILVAGLPGPKAIHRPQYFSRDTEYAQRLANDAWAESRAQWIGEWHTHPEGQASPSAADLNSYAGHVADSELAFDRFFSLIVTSPPAGSLCISAWTIDSHGAYSSFLRLTSMKEPL
jgi:integrative and conjugative element protein (TIGR02256 family)